MPAPAAEITIPVNVAATAFREGVQISFEAVVKSTGEASVRIVGRWADTQRIALAAEFDAYEFERFRKAIGECGELMQAIQERGATFKIG